MRAIICAIAMMFVTLSLFAQPGSIDLTFNPGSGANNEFVRRTLVQPDGKILVAGAFTQFNGQNKAYLVRLNPDGSMDEPSTQETGSMLLLLISVCSRMVKSSLLGHSQISTEPQLSALHD